MNSALLSLLAADAILLFHVLFVLFVVTGLALVILGAIRRWHWVRNPWFRLAHVAAIAVVVLQSWLGALCPLTTWEMALREHAGDAVYRGSFVAHWLERLLYYRAPAWVFTLGYTLFAVVVVTCWFRVRPRPFRKAARRRCP